MTPRTFPSGFVELRQDAQVWWVKEGWEHLVSSALRAFASSQSPIMERPATGGRGYVQRLPLDHGASAILRRYHRGGFLRHFVHDTYWDRPFRPLAELTCTETARLRGVPAVETLAAGIEWRPFGLYRGVFISREIAGAVNMWEWLQGTNIASERRAIIDATARTVASLHAAGVYHADLNLTNILVRPSPSPQAFIIDFDRARLFPSPLLQHLRQRNLRRLRRSLQKLDPHGHRYSPDDLETFCATYNEHYAVLSTRP